MLRQVGQATDIIINVQEYLELPPKAKFRDIVSNEKLRAGIDGVIDQELVADIIKKTDMEAAQIEQQLMSLSVNSALLPSKMLDVIGKKASAADIAKLVDNPDFIERLRVLKRNFVIIWIKLNRKPISLKTILLKLTCVWWSVSPRNTSDTACLCSI